MPQPSILVLGSVNTDLVIQGQKIPAIGETVVGGTFYRANGGKGANQAVAAARAGQLPVGFIAAVGDDDFGQAAMDGLAQENLDCRFVKTVPNTPSGVALILVDAQGRNCISVASGANAALSPADIEALPEGLFASAKVFLACLESPWETVLAGLERAKQAGALTILNPAPADRRWNDTNAACLVDIVTPNETEAGILTGVRVNDPASAFRAGQKLVDRGYATAVVTLGKDGSVVVGEVSRHVEAIAVAAQDTTAAGDAFNGTLAVALAEGRGLTQAVRWASIAAGLSVTRRGAQPSLPRREEIDDWEKQKN